MANYVKFLRGSLDAYKKLSQKQDDTLYFVWDEEGNTSLYLGEKLVSSGGDAAIDLENFSIDSLKDVMISQSLTDKSLLVYQVNGEKEGQWIDVSFNDEQLSFVGATSESSGQSGFVPAPEIGLTNYYLRSDGTWAPVLDEETQQKINSIEAISSLTQSNNASILSLQTQVNTIVNTTIDEKIDVKVAAAVASLLTLKKLNTYQELEDFIQNNSTIANKYLYMIPNENVYDEYVYINGQIEKVGNTSVSLEGYATEDWVNNAIKDLVDITTFQTTTNELQLEIEQLKGANKEINTSLDAVKDLVNNKNNEFTSSLNSLNEQIQSLLAADVNLDNRISNVEGQLTWKELK